VNGRDIDALTATLRRALEDDSLRSRMGQAARERVAREFDWPIVLERLHRVVLEALGEDAKP
jgi:glycosyltransferase involved in cell wall biosynthesis